MKIILETLQWINNLHGRVRKQLSEHVADSSSFRAAVHVRLFELSHEGTR